MNKTDVENQINSIIRELDHGACPHCICLGLKIWFFIMSWAGSNSNDDEFAGRMQTLSIRIIQLLKDNDKGGIKNIIKRMASEITQESLDKMTTDLLADSNLMGVDDLKHILQRNNV